MRWFRQAPGKALNREIDFDSDQLRFTLHTAGYVINPDTHAYVSDLTNELATGGGYAAGGPNASAVTRTFTAANGWAGQRAATTGYAVGDLVRPSAGNGFLYRCVVAGQTGVAEPAWPTVIGQNVADGAVTWECVGSGVWVLALADPSWPTATFAGARYLVLSDRTPASPAAQPLIGYVDFGADKAGSGGAFTVTMHPTLGALAITIP